jgi:copper(I)-binding protein
MSHKLVVFAVAMMIAAGAAAREGAVEITDAWARATPGKAENGAAYLTLESPAADRLTGLATPVAAKAELHMMTMEGGVMTMRPLAGIDLPPGQKVTLKPGGAHIMLVGLEQPLRPGQTFPLTLYFEKSGTSEVTVTVAKAGAAAMPGAIGPESHTGAGMKMPMTQPMQMPMPAGR